MVTLAMAAVRLLFARLGLRAFFGLRLVLNPACGVCYAAAPKFPSVAEVAGEASRGGIATGAGVGFESAKTA